MTDERICRTCTYYCPSRQNPRTGQCRARTPVPLMIGVQQAPRVPGLNGHASAQPIINAFFPPVNDTIWCGDWHQAEKIEQPETGNDLTPEAEALAEVEQAGNG